MTDIILINGCGGAGKETTSKALLKQCSHGAWLDIKGLIRVEPWEFGGEVGKLGIRNAAALIGNFISGGYDPVIFSGGINNQECLFLLDSLLESNSPRHFVWLEASKGVRDVRRHKRARDEGDKPQYLDQIASVFTDPGELVVPNGRYYRICSEVSPPEELAREILSWVRAKPEQRL